MDFSSYRKRVGDLGSSISGSINNHTIDYINSVFKDNVISYRDAILENGSIIGIRVIDGKNAGENKVLLRPNTDLNTGSVLMFDNDKWLVFEKYGSSTYPKLNIKKCNGNIAYKFNNDIYTLSVFITNLNAIRFDTRYDNMNIGLAEGEVYIYAGLNDFSKTVVLNQRFLMQGQAYEVSGIDNLSYAQNGVGVVKITSKITTLNTKDDFIFGLADNSHLSKQTGLEGGRLW